MNMWRSSGLLAAILCVVLAAMLLSPTAQAQGAQQVGVVILEMPYDSTANVYTLRLSITNPERVALLIVRVVDSNGTDVGQYHVYPRQSKTVDVAIDGSGLVPEGEYTIIVRAQDNNGNLLERPGDSTSGSLEERLNLAEWEFTHRAETSRTVEFTVESLNPDFDAGQLTIDLDVPTNAAVSSCDGYIVNSSGQKLLEFGPQPFTSTRLQVEMPQAMRQGGGEQEYLLTVNLTSPDNARSKAELEFKVQAPKGPGFFARVSEALSQNPIIAVAIASVLGAAVTAAILFSRRKPYRLPGGHPPPIDRTMSLPRSALPVAQPVAPPVARTAGQPAPRPPRLRVRVVQTPEASQVPDRVLEAFPVKFGRVNCEVSFPNDPKVSREHAEVTLQGGQFYIMDLKSTNGTYIGDTQLLPHVPSRLERTSRVRLGFTTILDLQVEA